MAVDAQIKTRASAFDGLTALIETRINVEKELSGTPEFPYVTFALVSTIEAFHTFSMPTDFDRDDQYDFAVWAKSHDSAVAIAKQIILAFHGYEVSGTCFILDRETAVPEEKEFIFHRVLTFVVHSSNDNS